MFGSFKKNRIGIILMLISAAFVSIGQMMWKLYHTEGIMYLISGFALYGIGAILMLIAYKHGSLSVLQPMLALAYVFAIFIAMFILGESMTITRVSGIIVIILGVVLIGGGDD